MSRRARLLAGLALVAAAQLAVPVAMIAAHERTLREGTLWRFRTAPVDPADAFRGRYVALGFPDAAAPVPAGLGVEAGDRVVVPLARDAEGFARLAAVRAEPPVGQDYLRARVRWVQEQEGHRLAHLELPFDRLYLEESAAPRAEEVYRRLALREGPLPAWAAVRVREGRAVLEDVVVAGTPLRQLAREAAAERSGNL